MITFTFPDRFLWGTAVSSFQVEGAANADGKGQSIWDVATARFPEKFFNNATPATAVDFYHQYPHDVKMMMDLGLKSFRFSIAWPRIFPDGDGAVNPKGLDFYDRLIDTLLDHGIEPFIDLYHWDLPQALADRGGFKNPAIVDIFARYAETCLARYASRVKRWSTVNEPSVMALTHYHSGAYPPFEKDLRAALLAGHHILLCHYRAVQILRDLNTAGRIGAVIAFVPIYPRSLSPADRQAAQRRQDFISGWWLDPMMEGHYPASVAEHPSVRGQLPTGFAEQLQKAFRPMDFLGVNYYTPARAGHKPGEFLDAEHVETFYAQTDYGFINYPPGLFDAMMYLKGRYAKPEIYITENGIAHDSQKGTAVNDGDPQRITYLREHLREVARAIAAGADIRGYYYWSQWDTFEATSGYRYRFGLVHVDPQTLHRTPRESWHYYQRCIAENAVD